MGEEDIGRVPAEPGSRPADGAASAAPPVGFDPSRKCKHFTFGVGAHWRFCWRCGADWASVLADKYGKRGKVDAALAWSQASASIAYAVEQSAPCDSDGSPKGGDACGSVHDGPVPEGDAPND